MSDKYTGGSWHLFDGDFEKVYKGGSVWVGGYRYIPRNEIPAYYLTKTCEYCGRKANGAYYPPLCDGCGASMEL